MRSFQAKAVLLALTCALGGGAAVGCSGGMDEAGNPAPSSSEDVGGVGLNLELADGITVDTVHYVITTDPGNTLVIEGDINVSDAAATISVLVGGLAPGNYVIALTATSTDGEVTCAGSAPFTISTGTTTNVTVDLECTNEDADGVVVANGQVTECTLDIIEYYTAAPLQTSTSGSIALTSLAEDVDGAQPDYLWTTTGGSTIGSASSPNTSFNCNGDAGIHTITLTVSTDSNLDIPGQPPVPCQQIVSFDVECIALTCGNGVLDAGETCDTALDACCPADCTLPVCGDGDLEGTAACGNAEFCDDGNASDIDNCPNDCSEIVCGDGDLEGSEACEPPGSSTPSGPCSATCQVPAAGCGNGIIEPALGETCEPPGVGSCDAACHTVAACGDGIVTAPETCELPQADNCGSSCTAVASTACFSCQNTNLNSFVSPHVCNFWLDTDMPVEGPAVGTGKSRRDLCWDLLACTMASECGEIAVSTCYCGSSATCTGATANGDCKAAVEAALESTDAGTIGVRFSDYTFGGAGALDFADNTRASCASSCYINPALPAAHL